MKPSTRYHLVLVTAPDLPTARRLARACLKARLIACANLIPRLESHYRWRGRIEHGSEVLLLLKTTAARWRRLEALILEAHPYDTPEIIALSLTAGNQAYLSWLQSCCIGAA